MDDITDKEEKVCASKTRFNMPRDAEAALEHLYELRPRLRGTITTYACRVCGGWHLTKDK